MLSLFDNSVVDAVCHKNVDFEAQNAKKWKKVVESG
jgi:hypothetical protein